MVTYQHATAHGDVIGTSNSAGTFTERPQPDEYGLDTVAPPDRLGWLGQQRRFTVGVHNLTRMGVRLYDPTSGRFTSVDPIEGGNATDYDYCTADPINCYDLDGQFGRSNVKKWWKKHKKKILVGAVVAGAVGCALVTACALAVVGATGTASWLASGAAAVGGGAAAAGCVHGYTRHELAQAMGRNGHGVAPRAILEAVRHGARSPSRGFATRYVGKSATVVLNRGGKVIATWATNRSGWRF